MLVTPILTGQTASIILPNMKARYDASILGLANNANVANFTDSSGNGFTASGLNLGSEVYKTNVRNGLSVVRFAGTAGIFGFNANFTISGFMSQYIVGAFSSTAGNPCILSCAKIGVSPSGGYLYYNDANLQNQTADGTGGWAQYGVNLGSISTNWFVAAQVWSNAGVSTSLWVSSLTTASNANTNGVGTSDPNYATGHGFLLGCLFNGLRTQPFVGDLGESITYTVPHSAGQVNTNMAALLVKWGF